MSIAFNVLIVLCASLIEAAFGYPDAIFRRVGHPVKWMGALIERQEKGLNPPSLPEPRRRLNGVLALSRLLLVSIVVALLLQGLASWFLPAWLAFLVIAALASTLIAQRSLHEHVAAVADALDARGLAGGREAVAKIVGRDPQTLDAAGVARAAIESLAENFSDGVVAPCFYGTLLGLPGMAAYKAVNTADSMIGHLTPRHTAFGWASAKLDDLLNLPASRLAAAWLILAALLDKGASARDALATVRNDAAHHRSPNAGWTEAAIAGALDLKLSGPRSYHGKLTEDAWIGEGRSEATANDIRHALRLYRSACAIEIGVLGLLALLIWQL
jgi:adenosylcobinamide-phosphate synthase